VTQQEKSVSGSAPNKVGSSKNNCRLILQIGYVYDWDCGSGGGSKCFSLKNTSFFKNHFLHQHIKTIRKHKKKNYFKQKKIQNLKQRGPNTPAIGSAQSHAN
jgi:hypothetical protein